MKGILSPSPRQWGGATLLGALIFLVDYGCLFWAEQKVPSGIAAVVLATIPVFITLLEIIFLRTQRLTVRLGFALLLGLCGVAVLTGQSFSFGEVPINRAGALALLVASFTWSVATILTRRLPLPDSKPMSAAAQMITGGVQLLILAALAGEFARFHPQTVSWNAWFSLAYLIIAGSIAGFTAYVWLLHYESPTKVGTYAYVNPVVAVALGYFIGGEAVGPRTLVGALLVLVSVISIATTPKRNSETREPSTLSIAEAD
jgi:drug/metabolite transporter (DMT)-like permease